MTGETVGDNDGQGQVADRGSEDLGSAGAGWYLAEGIPGTGERPEFLDSRYHTLADQAKAYKELEKRFSLMSGAPEDYDLGNLNSLKESPEVKDLMAYAKENKLSQEGMSKFFETFNKLAPTPDLAAEKAKLGDRADEMIDTIDRWATNNFSAKALETIGSISTRAEVVELLNEIRLKSLRNQSQPPHGDANLASPPKSLKDLQQEMITNIKKWETDPLYRKDMHQRMVDADEYEQMRRG